MDFWIPLERYEARYSSRYRALYHALRDAIREGRLQTGSRLPASRELASQYEMARGTVSRVYEMLIADGFLESRPGRGTFVLEHESESRRNPGRAHRPRLSRWATRIPASPAHSGSPAAAPRFDMRAGAPDPEIFPHRQWQTAMMRAAREDRTAGRRFRSAADRAPSGVMELREAIAAHLNRRRGLHIAAESVEIVSGSQQALGLLTHLLIDPGQPAVLENPGYFGIQNALAAVGGRAIYAPVDGEGLQISDWRARLLFVTPSHQFPTGAVLAWHRRRALLDWARKRDAMIIEDDYDSEFKREGLPVEPLCAMDSGDGRVIYTGTFSKTIHPGLRLGYVVLPEGLRDIFRRARRLFEAGSASRLEQLTLAAFMQSGDYERHLRRSIRIYRERHRAMLAAFARYLDGAFDWHASNAGLHVFGRWRRKGAAAQSFARFSERCREAGILFSPGAIFYAAEAGRRPPCALFGFSQLNPDRATSAIKTMGRIYRSLGDPD